jgi:HlyD family secretion protein
MFEEGDDIAQLRKLNLAIANSESEHTRALERLTQTEEMRAKDFVTSDQLEDEKIKVRNAKDAFDAAVEELHLYKTYKQPLEREQKTAAKRDAERGIETARKQADARLEQKRASHSEKARRLAQKREQLAQKQADLARMTITAPTDGVIIYGDPDRGWDAEEIRVGGDAYYDRVLMTIPDSSEMAVTINVHEADIGKVKDGMRATVRSELQRGTSHGAVVAKIDSVANAGNRRWGETVRRFKVELKIEGSGVELKPGTSASVDLQLGELENVLHVPIQAVHAKEGRFFCYARTGGGTKEMLVKVGRSNDAFLEILDGLSEGDEVLLYEPEAATVEGAKDEKGAAEKPDGQSGTQNGAARGNGEGRGNRGGERPAGRPEGAPRPAGGTGRPQP